MAHYALVVEWPNIAPIVIAAIIAAIGGILGRIMALTQAPAPPTLRALLQQMPTAIAMGWLARGSADYVSLSGFPAFGLAIAAGYLGPVAISGIFDALSAKNLPKPPK